jgi:RimJ/RimL family protein N-acetyltransferase
MILKIPTIYVLHDRPDWASICESWDLAEWPRSPEMAEFFAPHYTMASKSVPYSLPSVWVATVDDVPVGMVSVIEKDHPDFQNLGPWLAAAYVLPEWRNQGVFRLLHDTAIDAMRDHTQVEKIYSYTYMDFIKMGWEKGTETYDPFEPSKPVTIFSMRL